MKKITLILLMITLLMITGCKDDKQKNLYLPEAKNDKIYTTIGGESESHKGEGYTITIPEKDYRYEKEYDDGALEEKWEYTKKDDVEILPYLTLVLAKLKTDPNYWYYEFADKVRVQVVNNKTSRTFYIY